jgi:hypothetical protein
VSCTASIRNVTDTGSTVWYDSSSYLSKRLKRPITDSYSDNENKVLGSPT